MGALLTESIVIFLWLLLLTFTAKSIYIFKRNEGDTFYYDCIKNGKKFTNHPLHAFEQSCSVDKKERGSFFGLVGYGKQN